MSRSRDLARRIVAGIGLDEVIELRNRVDALEEAVAENAALEEPLEERVADLERRLVAPLEHRRRLGRSR